MVETSGTGTGILVAIFMSPTVVEIFPLYLMCKYCKTTASYLSRKCALPINGNYYDCSGGGTSLGLGGLELRAKYLIS